MYDKESTRSDGSLSKLHQPDDHAEPLARDGGSGIEDVGEDALTNIDQDGQASDLSDGLAGETGETGADGGIATLQPNGLEQIQPQVQPVDQHVNLSAAVHKNTDWLGRP